MNRGRRRERVFRDQEDYLRFVKVLQESSTMWNVRIAAFCLMSNHYHLLVQTPDANLSRFMRHVDGVYTQRFNRSHRCDGSLFRGRYKSILVEAETYLLELVKYIHRSPIRAGLVKRLDRYRWSSHAGYPSRSREWSWLDRGAVFSMLRGAKKDRRAAYRKFMSRRESDELRKIMSRKKIPSLLGSESFIEWVRSWFENRGDDREIPEWKASAPGLEAIKSAVCEAYDKDPGELLTSRRGVTNEARTVAIYLSRRLSGKTLVDIGKAFGLENYGSVSSAVSRMKRVMKDDTRLRRRVTRLEKQLRKAHNRT